MQLLDELLRSLIRCPLVQSNLLAVVTGFAHNPRDQTRQTAGFDLFVYSYVYSDFSFIALGQLAADRNLSLDYTPAVVRFVARFEKNDVADVCLHSDINVKYDQAYHT